MENGRNLTQKQEIKSFAFFDIETTGLPSHENNQTKITEISIVACSVEHFLRMKETELPRVLHKLTLCINPFKRISYESEKITGLSNDLLEKEKTFDKDAAETLSKFLSHLQQPCVLIAHNALAFDIPILKRLLRLCDANELNEDLLVADSLLIFREIDELEGFLLAEVSVRPASPNGTKTEEESKKEKEEKELDNFIMEELLSIKEPIKAIDLQKLNETTPAKQTISANNGQIPHKNPTNPALNEVTPQSSSKLLEKFNENKKRLRDCPPKARRDLFGAKKSFKLVDIYQKTFGKAPEHSHYAEADVIALLKCAIAKKEDFVRIVQDQAQFFKDIPALGQKTPRI